MRRCNLARLVMNPSPLVRILVVVVLFRALVGNPTIPYHNTIALLGTGAFSVVRSAVRKDGLKSAVKVVERRNLGKGDLESLRGEAKLLRELNHPNIIKLHGWYEEDTTLYMAMELCEGESSITFPILSERRGSPEVMRCDAVQCNAMKSECISIDFSMLPYSFGACLRPKDAHS